MAEGATTSGLRLTVQNFRGVRRASWAPEGVCALVGPNASGKSTLLEAFLFVHTLRPRDQVLDREPGPETGAILVPAAGASEIAADVDRRRLRRMAVPSLAFIGHFEPLR
jgi:polynucleotide 5'-kinase involved in rRNA processing